MSAPLGLRERKKLRTSSTIGQVTLDLVVEHGFDSVRVEDICAEAEVSRSTFFRYFDSKEASYVAGLHEGRLDAIVQAVQKRPDDEGPIEAIVNGLLDDLDGWRERRDLIVLDAAIRAAVPAVQARCDGEFLTWEIALAEAVEDRLPAGASRGIKARLIASVAVCALRMATDQWLADGARRSPARFYRRVFSCLDRVVTS
jgi:AcrR family transcriptional regulator